MPKLLLLELNEVNFDHVRTYVDLGELPNLGRLIERHGISETTSEQRYEELEPWIQWVTAHTGLPLNEHGVFRLGDIRKHDLQQIWEVLEGYGHRVGAISPMNAKNRCRRAAFFVPDPWTAGSVSAGLLLTRLYQALTQAVNDNAKGRITLGSAFWLAVAATRYALPRNYLRYFSLAAGSMAKPWSKAILLDLLLADVFVRETKRQDPHFASLFLNAAAHIQHHYMFNSAAYAGSRRNPEWYVDAKQDPVLDVYRTYDAIVANILATFGDARIMIATGLHQEPHPEVTFYWRLKDHAAYLRKVGVPFVRVDPRMSRDFLVTCSSHGEASEAERLLSSARTSDGVPLFEIENRGYDLFVTLSYPSDITSDVKYALGSKRFNDLRNDVVFVAIKNGQHNGVGYFIDTGLERSSSHGRFPLTELPSRICAAMGVEWSTLPDRAANL